MMMMRGSGNNQHLIQDTTVGIPRTQHVGSVTCNAAACIIDTVGPS